jgi:hypothetical protein
MKGDKLVPKKIKESDASPLAKRQLAELWQYEFDRAEKSRGPYKDLYKEVVSQGAKESDEN